MLARWPGVVVGKVKGEEKRYEGREGISVRGEREKWELNEQKKEKRV